MNPNSHTVSGSPRGGSGGHPVIMAAVCRSLGRISQPRPHLAYTRPLVLLSLCNPTHQIASRFRERRIPQCPRRLRAIKPVATGFSWALNGVSFPIRLKQCDQAKWRLKHQPPPTICGWVAEAAPGVTGRVRSIITALRGTILLSLRGIPRRRIASNSIAMTGLRHRIVGPDNCQPCDGESTTWCLSNSRLDGRINTVFGFNYPPVCGKRLHVHFDI